MVMNVPLMSCRGAAAHCSRKYGIKVPKTTFHRWCRNGIATSSGRVRLQHRRIGGRLYTSPGWIESFIDDLHRADEARLSPGATPPPTQNEILERRRDEIAEAEREADRRLNGAE